MAQLYEPEGSGAADSDCTPATQQNGVAPITRTNTINLNWIDSGPVTDEIGIAWTTPTNEPNSADWASADYRGQVDIPLMDADISIKIQLHRVNSGCTSQETLGTSGSFSGVGIKNFVVNLDPVSGDAGDRFQMRILISNSAHMTEAVVFRVSAGDTLMDWERLPIVGRRRFPHIPKSLRY